MLKGLSLAGAALLAATTLATPAFAQGNQPGSAGAGQGSGGQGEQQQQQGGQGSGGQGTGSSGTPGSGGTGSGQQSGSSTQTGTPAASGATTSTGGGVPTGPAMAMGSCGMMAGSYGMTDVNSGQVNQYTESVPALFFRVDYQNVPAPTTVGVIVRYNNELESQTNLATFTAQNTNGSYDGAIRANIEPSAQGFANSIDAGRRGRADGPPSGGNAEHGNPSAIRIAKGGLQGSGTQGGILPGEYVFYVYTGEIKDMPETVKDGPAGPRFFADEKGYLGKFSCGVSTENGSGPG